MQSGAQPWLCFATRPPTLVGFCGVVLCVPIVLPRLLWFSFPRLLNRCTWGPGVSVVTLYPRRCCLMQSVRALPGARGVPEELGLGFPQEPPDFEPIQSHRVRETRTTLVKMLQDTLHFAFSQLTQKLGRGRALGPSPTQSATRKAGRQTSLRDM